MHPLLILSIIAFLAINVIAIIQVLIEKQKVMKKENYIQYKEMILAEFHSGLVNSNLPSDDITHLVNAFNFINAPRVYDKFKNHADRREWMKTITPEQRAYLDKNQLRYNNLQMVLKAMAYAHFFVDVPPNQLTDQARYMMDNMKSYHNMNLKQKETYVDSIESLCVKFIEYMNGKING